MTITALDHIALVVRDLDATLEGLTRIFGREPNWRGTGGGMRHAWYQFGNTALDVLEPGEAGMAGAWMAQHGEGLWGLAFATDDMEAERKRLARLSIPSTEAFPVRTKDETGAARIWPTSVIDAGATAGVTTFLIGTTPDAAPWPVSPLVGDEGVGDEGVGDEAAAVSGLDHVVVSTPNPERAAALYGARLGLDFKLDRTNAAWGTRLMFFRVGGLVVEIAHPLKTPPSDNEDFLGGSRVKVFGITVAELTHPPAPPTSDDPDHLWGLTWAVPDIAAAHARMTTAGLSLSEIRTGRKPGTQVYTVKNAPGRVPTLIIGAA
jgi:catechol 2,3-dioxygenase-like lactoylglutathione lyase family enzyme